MNRKRSARLRNSIFLLLFLALASPALTSPALGQFNWFSRRVGGTTPCTTCTADVFGWGTSNPKLIVDGNSISAGYGLTTGELRYEQLLALDAPFTNSTITYINYAVSGQTTRDMASDAASQVDHDVALDTSRKVILIAWEVTNDLYYGQTVTQAENNFKQYCLDRKTAGVYRIVVVTSLPRNQTKQSGASISTYNSDLDATDTWLRAHYTEFADGLADVRTIPEFANLTAMLAGGLCPDGIHPSEAGLIKIKDVLRPVLLGLAP